MLSPTTCAAADAMVAESSSDSEALSGEEPDQVGLTTPIAQLLMEGTLKIRSVE